MPEIKFEHTHLYNKTKFLIVDEKICITEHLIQNAHFRDNNIVSQHYQMNFSKHQIHTIT